MPTLRALLGEHKRALRDLQDLNWLLDVDVSGFEIELRTQWILVQLVALVILNGRLQSMGFPAASIPAQGGAGDRVSAGLASCIDIYEREDLLSTRQLHWLRYFNRQANRAKHEFPRL